MEYIDYYKVLGVERTASPEEIARAYRRLARKHHPDVSKSADGEARFRQVCEANEVLKDPEKRARYDRYGQAWDAPQEGGWPRGWEVRYGAPADAGDLGGAGFSSFFEHLFGGRRADPGASPWDDLSARHHRGAADREATLQLSLEEALRGGPRTLTMRSAGGGERTLSVTIPAGILDGQKLRLAGQGEGTQDGQPGDLYLVVRHRPHARFRLEGRDLHTRIDVSPPVAVLGGRARLQTLDGQVVARVPPGSSSGTRIRLKGQGFPAGDGGLRGDLYAEVRIAVPHRLTPEERSLYERLARLQADELANTRTNR